MTMAFKRHFLGILESLFAGDRHKITDYFLWFPAVKFKEQSEMWLTNERTKARENLVQGLLSG